MDIQPAAVPPATVILDPVAARIVRGLMLRLRDLETGGEAPPVFAHWLPVKPDDEPITVTIHQADPAHGWSEPLPESIYLIEARRDG